MAAASAQEHEQQPRSLTIGQLARRTGLTVRTLHHYDAIGLLRPARRSGAGYRLYGPAEIRRLQRVVALRALGLSLDEVRSALARPEYSLAPVLELQAERLEVRIAALRRLRDRVVSCARRLHAAGTVPADELLILIEETTMFEKHFTLEQLDTLARRRETLGEDAIAAVEKEWPELIAKVQAALDAGKDPADPEVAALARRWRELVEMFTGGDAAIARGVAEGYRANPEFGRRMGLTAEVFDYAWRAIRALPA